MIEPETIIDGRYRVISRLGSGGMADVYLAEDQLLGRQLAVKVLHHHFAEDQEFVERFRREASSAAGLSHPNIVGIFDRGEWNGTYYIAMEYVAGRSLKTVVREQGALDPATAIDIVTQILRAARFAHKRGVIHRDLKPHNVILDEEGRARVTDFGIARAGASDMTLTGSIMGTAQYLSPEQAQGHVVSGRSDLYAIGIILYELLTGAVPFDGETAVAIAFKQVSAQARAPSERQPGLPGSLDAVVLRALAKDPARRFADAEEFIVALQQARQGLPAGASSVVAGAIADTVLATGGPYGAPPAMSPSMGVTLPESGALLLPPAGDFGAENGRGGQRSEQRDRFRRWLLWVSGALLLAALVALGLLLSSPGRVKVPDVVGQTEAGALTRLRRANLNPTAATTASTSVASGLVVSQTPPGGNEVGKGARVSILVSAGPGTAKLPAVEGLTAAKAVSKLRAAGFKPASEEQSSAKIAQGHVISTDPSAGLVLGVGSPITVFVSSGPAQVHVPNVTGQSLPAAETALTSAGLTLGTVTQRVSASQAQGTVLSQSPAAPSTLPTGGKVNLVVAQAPKEVAVPHVEGKTEVAATAALEKAGFTVNTVTEPTSEAGKVGHVLKQSPSAGSHAGKGATVTITIGMTAEPPPTTPTTPTTTPSTTAPATTPATPPLTPAPTPHP
ncbi:MAG TPA: Stk1 family PASTA domain-containing Ser/Thr kinase [Solirubrobacteraceae bacterium]|nr:Stk1 family PASTA domain-containing Ser/Thr kinase [Solirubrobacteraceae bacterium]